MGRKFTTTRPASVFLCRHLHYVAMVIGNRLMVHLQYNNVDIICDHCIIHTVLTFGIWVLTSSVSATKHQTVVAFETVYGAEFVNEKRSG